MPRTEKFQPRPTSFQPQESRTSASEIVYQSESPRIMATLLISIVAAHAVQLSENSCLRNTPDWLMSFHVAASLVIVMVVVSMLTEIARAVTNDEILLVVFFIRSRPFDLIILL